LNLRFAADRQPAQRLATAQIELDGEAKFAALFDRQLHFGVNAVAQNGDGLTRLESMGFLVEGELRRAAQTAIVRQTDHHGRLQPFHGFASGQARVGRQFEFAA